MAKKPLVSIIVLNYNGKRWLEDCLPSVKKLTYPAVEIIVVNNGSWDDSASFVKKKFPQFKLLEIQPNRGYAGGNNAGVKAAKGKYIMILNNDTTVSPGLLEPLVELMEKDKTVGVVQPKMINMRYKQNYDCVAAFYTSNGFLYHYGFMQSIKNKMYDKTLDCYSIKGACLMMRRDDFMRLGGFDEDFVCYVEETDLCHRVLLDGKRIVYHPKSSMYHYSGGDMSLMEKSETTVFRSFRNRFISYFKNFETKELIRMIPFHIILCEGYILSTLLKGKFKNAAAAQWGVLWWMFHFPYILKKRKYVQTKIRKVADKDYMHLIKHNPPFSYFVHFFTNPLGEYKEAPIKSS